MNKTYQSRVQQSFIWWVLNIQPALMRCYNKHIHSNTSKPENQVPTDDSWGKDLTVIFYTLLPFTYPAKCLPHSHVHYSANLANICSRLNILQIKCSSWKFGLFTMIHWSLSPSTMWHISILSLYGNLKVK